MKLDKVIDDLGETLVSSGAITQDQYDRAVSRVMERTQMIEVEYSGRTYNYYNRIAYFAALTYIERFGQNSGYVHEKLADLEPLEDKMGTLLTVEHRLDDTCLQIFLDLLNSPLDVQSLRVICRHLVNGYIN